MSVARLKNSASIHIEILIRLKFICMTMTYIKFRVIEKKYALSGRGFSHIFSDYIYICNISVRVFLHNHQCYNHASIHVKSNLCVVCFLYPVIRHFQKAFGHSICHSKAPNLEIQPFHAKFPFLRYMYIELISNHLAYNIY